MCVCVCVCVCVCARAHVRMSVHACVCGGFDSSQIMKWLTSFKIRKFRTVKNSTVQYNYIAYRNLTLCVVTGEIWRRPQQG